MALKLPVHNLTYSLVLLLLGASREVGALVSLVGGLEALEHRLHRGTDHRMKLGLSLLRIVERCPR